MGQQGECKTIKSKIPHNSWLYQESLTSTAPATPPTSPKKKKARLTLDTVYDTVIFPVFGSVFKDSGNKVLSGIIHPSQCNATSIEAILPENDLITHIHVPEDVFIETKASGSNERNDDATGEFEHVEASQCDMIGNSGLDASESIGASSDRPTKTFIASPLLDNAQLALDNLKKKNFTHHRLLMQSMVDTKIPDWIHTLELALKR